MQKLRTFGVLLAESNPFFSVFLVCVPFPARAVTRFERPIPRGYYQMCVNVWILFEAKFASFVEFYRRGILRSTQ